MTLRSGDGGDRIVDASALMKSTDELERRRISDCPQ
jgi:hypothetical protein